MTVFGNFPNDPATQLPINTEVSEAAALVLLEQRLRAEDFWVAWTDTGGTVTLPSGLVVHGDWNAMAHLGRLLSAGTPCRDVLPLWAVMYDLSTLPAYTPRQCLTW